MMYHGSAQIFRSHQPMAVGEGQQETCVGIQGLAEGAAGLWCAWGGNLAWLIAGKVVEQGAVVF